MSVKSGLPMIAPKDARLFILGSLPGDASLFAQRYYAHPTNQFWLLLGRALGEELPLLSYEQRLQRLADRRIGLWDVIASASRRGSLDQAIREAEHNRIAHLLGDFPDLAAIAFNGSTAALIGRRLITAPPEAVVLLDLPSSSAANTVSLERKMRDWSRLAQFASPAQTAADDSPGRR